MIEATIKKKRSKLLEFVVILETFEINSVGIALQNWVDVAGDDS
jgi:hypothetical protein